MTDSQQLLAEYVGTGSERAFRDLVSRYINLVYAAALRQMEGDTHLAQDVTQAVFTDLARKAGRLAGDSTLGGWLHRHTCFVSSNLKRAEHRRHLRERQAVELHSQPDHTEDNLARVAPVLDEAINELASEDRTAIVLRFFEQRDFRAIGQALGSTDDAAQKRVSRALEKLHLLLRQRGVAFSTTALATTLAATTVTAAPVGLVATVSGLAVAGAAQSASLLPILKLTVMTKLKSGVFGAIIVGGVAASLVIQQQAQGRLRDLNDSSRLQLEQLDSLQAENQRLNGLLEVKSTPAADQLKDLERLRREAAALRTQSADLEELKARAKQRPQPSSTTKTALQIKEESIVVMNNSKNWLLAFHMYANKNKGEFPATSSRHPHSFDRKTGRAPIQSPIVLMSFTPAPSKRSKLPGATIVLRDKEATQLPNGTWQKIYGYADGHIEVRNEASGDFTAYETEHIIQPTAN